MASQHVEIKGNETRFAETYRRFIGDCLGIRDRARNFLAIMEQAHYADAQGTVNWQGLVDLLGLTTADPLADVQTIYQLHTDMKQKLDSSAVDAFVNRLG